MAPSYREGGSLLPGWLLALLTWGLALAPRLSPGAEPDAPPAMAAIPYRAVADILEGFAKVKERDKLHLAVRIVPAKGGTPPTPLQLELRGQQGPIPVKLAPSGELVDFPLTPALRAENPKLVSNQPKGSLKLEAALALRYSGKLIENPAWYLDALAQANAAIKSQAGLLSFVVPKLDTVVFEFAPSAGAPAQVTLRTDTGEKSIAADAEGRVRVKLGPETTRKGARLTLPTEPRRITAE